MPRAHSLCKPALELLDRVLEVHLAKRWRLVQRAVASRRDGMTAGTMLLEKRRAVGKSAVCIRREYITCQDGQGYEWNKCKTTKHHHGQASRHVVIWAEQISSCFRSIEASLLGFMISTSLPQVNRCQDISSRPQQPSCKAFSVVKKALFPPVLDRARIEARSIRPALRESIRPRPSRPR